jgi:tetratricopeptide (TPR) repeat protein/outer membrane protein assembly factor BamB
VILVLGWVFPSGFPAEKTPPYFQVLWKADTPFIAPNDPVVVDLNADGANEIVISDSKGRLTVFAGKTGDILWSVMLKGVSLTGPVAGHFWGDGSLDVAVADNRGFVHLFNGGNGHVLQQMVLKTPVVLDPTLLPPDPDRDTTGSLNFHPEAKDHLIVIDDENTLHCLVFDPDREKAGIIWEKSLGGRAMAPASIGDVDGDGHFEVVAGLAQSRQGVLHVLHARDGTPLGEAPEPYVSNIVTIASLADVNADGRDEIFFGTKSSHLYGIRLDPTTGRLGPLWEKASTVREPTGDPVILLGQSVEDTTVIIQTQNILVLRPMTGGVGIDQQTQASITSFLGVASSGRNARARLIFGDQLGDVYDWWVNGLEEKASVKLRGEQLGLTPVLADFDGQPGAECLLCFPLQRRLRMVAVPEIAAEPGAILWQTRAGTLWRTGWRDLRYYEALRQRYAYVTRLIDLNLATAREAITAHAWTTALNASSLILDVNPRHTVARKEHRRAWIRKHLIVLSLYGLAGASLLGALLYGSFLIAVRKVGLKQAADLIAAGQMDGAIALYLRLHQRFPTHALTNKTLANLLIEQDRLEIEYVSVFEHAHADHPAESRFLQGLSECYARAESLLPKARDVYLKSLDVSTRPAELKFLIGRSFLAERRFHEAARFLGEALADGFQNERVYQALADVYIELRFQQAEILPILEKVLPQRGEDVRFLAYLCEVCLANNRLDEAAFKCAQHALALDPTCDAAHFLAIRVLLEHRQVENAWRRAEALLRRQPDHPEVLRMAAHCLIALERRDDEAIQILERALDRHPNDAPILAHLSHVYFALHRFDSHAAAVHRRAYEVCPKDDGIVEAMAQLAEKENDKKALMRYLEALIALGRESRDLLLRLARVYLDLGIESAHARRAYEVAVQENPDNPDFLLALAKIYLATGETSPAAVAVLGRLHSEGVRLPGLDRQLIVAMDRNADYTTLTEMCDAWLTTHRDDVEVKRIRAHAHLAAGQTQRAVEEYEQLLQRSPDSEPIVTELAVAYARAARSDDRAISFYRRALRAAPQLDVLYRALGGALAQRGDLPDAIAQFRSALRARKDCVSDLVDQCQALLEEDAGRIPLRWFLCEVLINCGRFHEAVDQLGVLYDQEPDAHDRVLEALGHILDVDRENVYGWRARGGLFLRLGRLAEARGDLEAANRLQPHNEQTEADLKTVYGALLAESEDPELRLRLAQIHLAADDLDAALRCFQKSVRDYRFEGESTRGMGRVFMQKNLLDLALEEFQKLPLDDDLKETLYQLGQSYEQRGDARGARAAYRLIFAVDAGFRDVQQRFEALQGEGTGEKATAFDRTMILSQLSEKAKHRYKLLEEVGRGAMGIVYRAMDNELDEIVALKILPDNLSSNTEALARFRREARSARRLSHRNIVRIHDIGEEMGRKYISMEFVEGATLKNLIRAAGGLEIPRILKYGCQILDALAYAHSIGIVHRDIKPANIIISHEDEVKITDFGIAKILESAESTSEGAVIGTPLYMSPEQVRGEPVDHRADLYSVGILLYECIEGKPPFLKGDLAYSHLHVFPEPMEHGFADLNTLIMRALEKRREDRWPSAQMMLDALRSLHLPD